MEGERKGGEFFKVDCGTSESKLVASVFLFDRDSHV